MRTFWIWSIVFLSGFLAALIVAPILTGQDAPEGAGEAPAPLIAEVKDQAPSKPPEKTPEQKRAEDLDALYRGDALTTLGMLKAQMRDPGSTQFRNLWVVNISKENTDLPAVCGEVNSKNGFGAYTGFTPFLAANDYVITAGEDSFETMYATNCAPQRRVLQLIY